MDKCETSRDRCDAHDAESVASRAGQPQALLHYLTLGQATKFAPGRPSANAVWRWARRGVLARSGERVRLQHVRAGGKVLTTAAWVVEFCTKLAHADAAYFDGKDAAGSRLSPRCPTFAPPSRSHKSNDDEVQKRAGQDALDAELDAEGL
jgi:hypothetical protein